MNVDMLLKHHPCIISSETIIEICQPLKKLGITYFGHAIIHSDGKVSGICNNPEYIHFYFKNKFFNLDLHMDEKVRTAEYICWDFMPKLNDLKHYYQSTEVFHIYHTFSLIKREALTTHIYHFATDHFQPGMNTFFMANRDLLDKFIVYYTEKFNISNNLKTAHTMFMPLEKNVTASNLLDYTRQMITEKSINEFLNEIATSPTEESYPFTMDMQILSHREKQCLYMLAHGHSAKTIAKSLNLSPRTIYFYIENMKKKIGHHRKNELVEYYWQYFAEDK